MNLALAVPFSSATPAPAAPAPAPAPAESARRLPLALRVPAFLFAFFILVNRLGELFRPRFAADEFWLLLPGLPDALVAAGTLFLAVALLLTALRRLRGRGWRRAAAAVVGLAALGAAWDVAVYYRLLLDGAIMTRQPLPLSLFWAFFFAVYALLLLRERSPVTQAPSPASESIAAEGGRATAVTVVAATMLALLVGLGFPLALFVTHGLTSYERPADAALVFGAGVGADGRPSLALEDRVRTAARLYHDGLARKLILSGGPGPGAVSEPEAMRRLAVELGVPESALILDEAGLSTGATAAHARELLARAGGRSLLAVSHYYHLPRVRMALRREGLEARTVPARMSRRLQEEPYYLLRECAAFWFYYLFRG